ncbi:DUF1642 domain-containing protein [Listeria monocytogenes]|nr:DUF1642 domain-containing protein [Listeria monocytogenes]EAD0383109.1 DUF1642 domain-containing protein [Listeria monocytogenes]EAF2023452.1 DUF1642 domain-containing protein [Listeria monocytogenes]
MNFKVGDRVEFIYRNKKGIGEINGVYPELREVTIKQSDSPVDLLFSDKAVAKIEEPELVVVPQCVADWYEDNKDDLEHRIWKYIRDWVEQDRHSNFYDFMDDSNLKPIEILIKMKYGYEVEKEPLYYVKLIEKVFGYLNERNDGRRYLNDNVQTDISKTKFTEAEIKEMDERYWQFAVPVEEVEE